MSPFVDPLILGVLFPEYIPGHMKSVIDFALAYGCTESKDKYKSRFFSHSDPEVMRKIRELKREYGKD